MAMPSTKSSSLGGRSNPNSRSSELTDPMRRSSAANPFAKPSFIPDPNPRNTPSDFPRRNSVGGGREGATAGSFIRDLDDKENGRDPNMKPWKARSPAAKNFMAPTISASSKVTMSPRKKVLVDRNEPVRASAPSAATKSPIKKVTFAEPLRYSCDMKVEGGAVLKQFEALSSLDDGVPKGELHNSAFTLSCEELCGGEPVHDTDVNFDAKNVGGEPASFATVVDEPEPDCVNLDPSFKLSPTHNTPLPVSSSSDIVAPLDADPLMSPYDPKTNYLSPRPQFLHYRPKERIELDDNFTSGSFSDTEVTEDTQSEGSQKESEDVSSDERVEEEQSPARTLLAEQTVEAKEKPKQRLFMRWKAGIALLLLLSVALLSITGINSSVMDGTVFQDAYRMYESSEFSEFAKVHFDQFSAFAKGRFHGLSQNFHTWFTRSLSSMSELISNVRGSPSFGYLQYYNLSILHEYNAVDQGPIFGRGENQIGEAAQVHLPVLDIEDSDDAIVTETDDDDNIEGVSAEYYDSHHDEQVQQDSEVVVTAVEKASDDASKSEVFERQQANTIESDQALQLPEVNEPIQDQPSLDSEAADIHIEVSNAENLEAKQPQDDNSFLQDQPGLDSEVADILTEADGDHDRKLIEANEESISMDAAVEGIGQRLKTMDLQPDMLLYMLLFGSTILIGGAVFNWRMKWKSRRSTRVVTTSSVEQPLFANSNSLVTPKQEQSNLDKPYTRNDPTEIDMHGESCSSEMSSIQKGSSSYRQRLMKEYNDEVQSHEEQQAKKRRESMASSDYSMGSPSYGSFTTYERIQIKNGHGNGKTVTPVRRSSRIKSQAISPL